jgi:hypothetical protein
MIGSQILDHGLVDLGVFAGEHQLDILAQVAGEVAGDARVLLNRRPTGCMRVFITAFCMSETSRSSWPTPASSACRVSVPVMPLRISCAGH